MGKLCLNEAIKLDLETMAIYALMSSMYAESHILEAIYLSIISQIVSERLICKEDEEALNNFGLLLRESIFTKYSHLFLHLKSCPTIGNE